MNTREQWIFPGMPVLSLMRARPASLPVLERFGLDPWPDPQAHLEALAAARGIPWDALEAALDALPPPVPDRDGADRDWGCASIPDLLDQLVADHRDILERLVPGLEAALARAAARDDGPLAAWARAWPGFAGDLAAHMREEEVFLFPRILHYAYCVRHRGRHPDFGGGSVNVYIAIRLLGNEHRQTEAWRRYLADWDALASLPGGDTPQGRDLRESLAALRDRLERHNHLEESVLYPKARDLEKSLYDAAIAGSAR